MNNSFRSFIVKEFRHIFRDWRSMLILLVMPVVLIVMLGVAISTDVRNVKVAYLSNCDGAESVERIVSRIDASDNFTVVGRAFSTDEISEMMKAGRADAAVRFYESAGLQIIVDASNPNIGASEAMYLQSILLSDAATGMKTPTVRMLYNPRLQSSYNFIPGILGLILMLICAMMTSISIVREKETGTMEVLLTSPIEPLSIIFAKMIPYIAISCIDIATILLLAKFAMHVPMSGSLALILLFALVYTVMSLSLGLLISTVTKSQVTALLLSAVVLMVPVMMLSGMMFPIDSMPGFFRVISVAVPARWFIDAMRKLMIEGLSFGYVAKDLAILLGMTLAFLTVALKNFKARLE
jgi:ABC-2 type transport system permease protein